MRTPTILFLALLFAALPAQNPEDIKQAVGVLKDGPGAGANQLGGETSFGKIDEDWFLFLNARLDIDLGKVGFGVQAPLRFRIVDNDPPDRDDIDDVLRKEDWDEFSDYLKILRYVRYGRKGDTLHGTFGELRKASIGHGTIVHRYYNNVQVDHHRTGMTLDVNTDYGGFESLAGDLIGTGLYAGRAYLRPWSFVDEQSWWKRIGLGFTLATDLKAPYELEDASGAPVLNVVTQQPAVSAENNLRVHSDKRATVFGADIELKLLDLDLLALTPYIDLNHVVDGGTGYHQGVLGRVDIPVLSIQLEGRLEYRNLDGDYVPAYFDSFYEVQRYGFPFRDKNGLFGAAPGTEVGSVPKRRVVEVLDRADRLDGIYAEANLDAQGLFTVGGSYDDYEGPLNSNLRLFLDVPALDEFKFTCYYYKHNFDTWREAFSFDERSLFLLEGQYPLGPGLYLVARFWRVWRLDRSSGEYEPVDDISLGINMGFTF